MDLENIVLTEVNQSKKDKYHYDITYMWDLNKMKETNELTKGDDAMKVLHSICQQIWKTQQWPQDWIRSVFIPIPKNGNAKNAPTTVQLHSFHMLVKLCSKFSKPGFNST